MSQNLFANVPQKLPQELVDILAESQQVRIERIVSTGHQSPADFWYDQTETEWVLVLQGEAVLEYETKESQRLKSGDWVLIPAHRKHRVVWTSSNEPTIWLAVFFRE